MLLKRSIRNIKLRNISFSKTIYQYRMMSTNPQGDRLPNETSEKLKHSEVIKQKISEEEKHINVEKR